MTQGQSPRIFCQDEHGKQAGFANRHAVPCEPQTLQFNLDGFACRLPAIQVDLGSCSEYRNGESMDGDGDYSPLFGQIYFGPVVLVL